MAENFSSYISAYLKAHPEASLSSVKDALGSLREDLYHSGSGINTIWPDNLEEGQDLTTDDFMVFMSNATQKNIDELDADTMNLFFDIMDKDDDGKLNQDELDIFKNKNGEYTDFKMWSVLNNYSENNLNNFTRIDVKSSFEKDENYITAYNDIFGEGAADDVKSGDVDIELQELSDTKIYELAEKIVNDENGLSLSHYYDYLTEDTYQALEKKVKELRESKSEETAKTEASADKTEESQTEKTKSNTETEAKEMSTIVNIEGADDYNKTETNSSTTNTNSASTANESDLKKEIDNICSSGGSVFETPQDVISAWLKAGKIDKDTASDLEYEYMKFSDNDEKSIEQYMMAFPDKSRRETIVYLMKEGKISLPVQTAQTPLDSIQSSDVDINVEQYVKDLKNAMKGDTDELEEILLNSSLSDNEIIEIVKLYEKKYGRDSGGKSLVTQLEKATSGEMQEKLTKGLAQRLVHAANNGNEEAIDILCKEIYGGTAGQNYTANSFLETLFLEGGLSDEVIGKVAERYELVNPGHDIITDIKKDYAGILNWRVIFDQKASGKGNDIISRIKSARRNTPASSNLPIV